MGPWIEKDLGKGYIYIYIYYLFIFLEQQARGTQKDAMGIKNDAKKLWEILFYLGKRG